MAQVIATLPTTCLTNYFGFLRFQTNLQVMDGPAGQVCKKWMVMRANLQVMGVLAAGPHPLLAIMPENPEIQLVRIIILT